MTRARIALILGLGLALSIGAAHVATAAAVARGIHLELVKTDGGKTVWLIDNDRTRRAFTTAALFGPNGFWWSKVKLVEPEWLERYPIGPSFDIK